MESHLSLLRMHRDREPGSPLTRRCAPPSPPLARGERERLFLLAFYPGRQSVLAHGHHALALGCWMAAFEAAQVEPTNVGCYEVHGKRPFAFAHASRP